MIRSFTSLPHYILYSVLSVLFIGKINSKNIRKLKVKLILKKRELKFQQISKQFYNSKLHIICVAQSYIDDNLLQNVDQSI